MYTFYKIHSLVLGFKGFKPSSLRTNESMKTCRRKLNLEKVLY